MTGCNIADVCNKQLKYWTETQHYIALNNLPGHKHGKCFISRPSNQSAEELKLSRPQLRVVVEFLMERAPMRKHLNSVDVFEGNLDCIFCKVDTENSVPYYLLLQGLSLSVL